MERRLGNIHVPGARCANLPIQSTSYDIKFVPADHSTCKTSPFRYSPSGWKIFTQWSVGSGRWYNTLTGLPASMAAAITVLLKVFLSTPCEQEKVNSNPPGLICLIAS